MRRFSTSSKGYAGGIVSSAVDGNVVAEAVLESMFDGSERARQKDDSLKGVKGLGTFY